MLTMFLEPECIFITMLYYLSLVTQLLLISEVIKAT